MCIEVKLPKGMLPPGGATTSRAHTAVKIAPHYFTEVTLTLTLTLIPIDAVIARLKLLHFSGREVEKYQAACLILLNF